MTNAVTSFAAMKRAEEHAEVSRYVWFHAARGYVHAEAGEMASARVDYTRALALTFSYPIFLSQAGMEFWLLNATLFAAARHALRSSAAS